ncbi:MAG: hypothetical protein PHR83_15895 [Paludibacter sp.]|nr:hypothetical protein [Paludibacter sp.]
MKTCKIYFSALLMMSSLISFGQRPQIITFANPDPLSVLPFEKRYLNQDYHDFDNIDGTPYLNDEFINGTFYIKDTAAFKLPIRYNIYADHMEYKMDGIIYYVDSPQSVSKIVLGESTFIYLSFIEKGGYYELLEAGKYKLVQKRRVEFKHSETKPIEGLIRSRYESNTDLFYLVNNQNQAFKIGNMNSVLKALQDQRTKIETFIKLEKIRNTKKENLIKIIKYYNSL